MTIYFYRYLNLNLRLFEITQEWFRDCWHLIAANLNGFVSGCHNDNNDIILCKIILSSQIGGAPIHDNIFCRQVWIVTLITLQPISGDVKVIAKCQRTLRKDLLTCKSTILSLQRRLELYEHCVKKCPLPCFEDQFEITMSTSLWPSSTQVEEFYYKYINGRILKSVQTMNQRWKRNISLF